MICITGNESDLRQLEARLAAHPGEFHEIRLDLLRNPGEDALDLIRKHPEAIVCCRPERAGGGYGGAEGDRRALLTRAAASGARWIDLEHDALDPTPDLQRRGAKVIGSFHDFTGVPANLGSTGSEIAGRGVEAVKLAVHVKDAAELVHLREQTREIAAPKVVIGMGAAGLISRAQYPWFDSLWTYVVAAEGASTAEGQLTLDQARALGLPESASQPFIALIGDSRIAASPGPGVYNRLFRERGLPWSYVAVVTAQPERTLDLLQNLGALGASVTIPHKSRVLSAAAPDEVATSVGAANSIRFRGGRAEATNTDVAGVALPLAAALRQRGGRRAVILGRGGAARAAAAACEELKLPAAMIGRDSWDGRAEVTAEILINATPIVDGSIWPDGAPLRKEIVFDLALGATESPLLAMARAEGAVAIGPEEMWVTQGAEQMSWITGVRFTAEELRGHLR